MGTILFSCVCDSIAAKLCGECRCITEIHEAGTNFDDLRIVVAVCVTISVVVLIGAITFLIWKFKEINAKKITTLPQNDNSQDCTIKLAEKLLDFLKSQTVEYGDKGEFKKYKEINTPECKMYNEVLTCLIESQQEREKMIDIEKLREALQTTGKDKQ